MSIPAESTCAQHPNNLHRPETVNSSGDKDFKNYGLERCSLEAAQGGLTLCLRRI